MLNDSLVLFGMKDSMMALDVDISKKYHVFDSQFFLKLESDGYDGVRRWTKRVNIFEKDYVVIAVEMKSHFSLFVVIRPGLVLPESAVAVKVEQNSNLPCIVHIDSLMLHDSKYIANKILS